MKKRSLFLILGLVLIASIAFIGCDTDDGVTPPVEEPPAEIVLEWMDIVPEGFWQITKVSTDITVTRSAGDPYEFISDMYIVFADDGAVNLWYDANTDGILSPAEFIGDVGPWELVDGVLTIDGQPFDLGTVNENDWVMMIDILDTSIGEALVDAGYDVNGFATIYFNRAIPVYEDESHLISTSFPFAFADRNETGMVYELYRKGCWIKTYYLDGEEVFLDDADGFYFTWGENDIVIVTLDGDDASFVFVNGELYWETTEEEGFVFKDSVVYDMTVVAHPNDIATFEFVSRFDASDTFIVPTAIDYASLGAVTIILTNDVAGLVL